jgi:dynein intermediate chain
MGLDFHPVRGPVDLGDLLLSSALDWTVKLWKIRPSSTMVATTSISTVAALTNGVEQAVEPLFEFSREEVIYDARWSPHKPGVFALVDGAGSVEIWDLTVDTEVPVSSASPEVNRVAMQTSYVAKSLNKVVWEEKEGKRLAVGGAAGVVSVFEVGNELAGEGVRGEEWTSMKRLVGRAEAGRRT